ncbi:hypothetical protein MLD38_022467 [Melastoma candidum]|uniref:Uncharacterized protein n=1 Tax=Melastoma candidum TaxID=119954 RepID=A0ACB9QSG5_9MYRT|nr:hypothetical protein MLD38_022467 [Melastoma candidum]
MVERCRLTLLEWQNLVAVLSGLSTIECWDGRGCQGCGDLPWRKCRRRRVVTTVTVAHSDSGSVGGELLSELWLLTLMVEVKAEGLLSGLRLLTLMMEVKTNKTLRVPPRSGNPNNYTKG